jgi:hypothetical protein
VACFGVRGVGCVAPSIAPLLPLPLPLQNARGEVVPDRSFNTGEAGACPLHSLSCGQSATMNSIAGAGGCSCVEAPSSTSLSLSVSFNCLVTHSLHTVALPQPCLPQH